MSDKKDGAEAIGYLIGAVVVLAALAVAVAVVSSIVLAISAGGACYGAVRAIANYGAALRDHTSLFAAPKNKAGL